MGWMDATLLVYSHRAMKDLGTLCAYVPLVQALHPLTWSVVVVLSTYLPYIGTCTYLPTGPACIGLSSIHPSVPILLPAINLLLQTRLPINGRTAWDGRDTHE